MSENIFNLIGLLDLYADSDRVDGWFHEDLLIGIAGDGQRCKEGFGRFPSKTRPYEVSRWTMRAPVDASLCSPRLDFWSVMSLYDLRSQTEDQNDELADWGHRRRLRTTTDLTGKVLDG